MQEGLKNIQRTKSINQAAKRYGTRRDQPEEIVTTHTDNERENRMPMHNEETGTAKRDMNTPNSKEFIIPNNPQFVRKWQMFQTAVQQLTREWEEIFQECTNQTVVCEMIEKQKATTTTHNEQTTLITQSTEETQTKPTREPMEPNFADNLKKIRRSPRLNSIRTYAEVVAQMNSETIPMKTNESKESNPDSERERAGNARKTQPEPRNDQTMKKMESPHWQRETALPNPERTLDIPRDRDGSGIDPNGIHPDNKKANKKTGNGGMPNKQAMQKGSHLKDAYTKKKSVRNQSKSPYPDGSPDTPGDLDGSSNIGNGEQGEITEKNMTEGTRMADPEESQVTLNKSKHRGEAPSPDWSPDTPGDQAGFPNEEPGKQDKLTGKIMHKRNKRHETEEDSTKISKGCNQRETPYTEGSTHITGDIAGSSNTDSGQRSQIKRRTMSERNKKAEKGGGLPTLSKTHHKQTATSTDGSPDTTVDTKKSLSAEMGKQDKTTRKSGSEGNRRTETGEDLAALSKHHDLSKAHSPDEPPDITGDTNEFPNTDIDQTDKTTGRPMYKSSKTVITGKDLATIRETHNQTKAPTPDGSPDIPGDPDGLPNMDTGKGGPATSKINQYSDVDTHKECSVIEIVRHIPYKLEDDARTQRKQKRHKKSATLHYIKTKTTSDWTLDTTRDRDELAPDQEMEMEDGEVPQRVNLTSHQHNRTQSLRKRNPERDQDYEHAAHSRQRRQMRADTRRGQEVELIQDDARGHYHYGHPRYPRGATDQCIWMDTEVRMGLHTARAPLTEESDDIQNPHYFCEPEEWRRLPASSFNLRDFLLGKPVFPKRAIQQQCRHFQEAPPHIVEFLRKIADDPIAMATEWRKNPLDTSGLCRKDKQEFDRRVNILRNMRLPPRVATPEEEEQEDDITSLTEEEQQQEMHEANWPYFSRGTCSPIIDPDEMNPDDIGLPHTYQYAYIPSSDSPHQNEAEDYDTEDMNGTSHPSSCDDALEDSLLMLPTDNEYINSHKDPTEAQIAYILTKLITRKERFTLIKELTNGSQARRLTNSESANRKRNKKASARSKVKAKQARRATFQIWIDGAPTTVAQISSNTTAQQLIEQICPRAPPEYISLRHKGYIWPLRSTAASVGIQRMDTIRVICKGMGGMELAIDQMEEERGEDELESDKWQAVANKKQKTQRSARQSKLTFQTPTKPSQDPAQVETAGTQLDNDEIHVATHTPAETHDALEQTRRNYRNDPFTRPFLYKQIPAQKLTVQQQQDLANHMLGQVQQIVDLVVDASTIQAGPMVMSQIPDVITNLKKMGYPIDIPATLQAISSNTHHRYVHNFDRKKPERCTINIELSKPAEFAILPSDDVTLPLWKQFILPVNPGENSYIKVQPRHPPWEQVYPLCTFYDIHTGIMQLDMIQHCYLILKQCFTEQEMKQIFIEFRMGSTANPTYDVKEPRSRKRMTTSYGIVNISKAPEETRTSPVEWIVPLQARLRARATSRGPNTRTSIIQGPYSIGITFGRYQETPPMYHNLDRNITSDPMISLLHVQPHFAHEKMGAAIDHICTLLRGTNLILSIHIREDWNQEEEVHHLSKLSLAFTMTGPAMTEAVRSIMQSDIQEMLNNPIINIVLPNEFPRPRPWNRVQELTGSRVNSPKPASMGGHMKGEERPKDSNFRTVPQERVNTAWNSRTSSEPIGPWVTQTYDISGIIGLPETIQRINLRMDHIETQAASAQSKLETQLAAMANALQTISQSVQSLVAANATPRDSNP